MAKVRWGLLSTANINRRLIPVIRESKRGELMAVASRNQETAAAYAVQWEIPRTFPSYQSMLDSDDIDAVYISLPNHLHAEWTVKALQSGKHVLCEKPFAITLAEVDQMIATAEETGLILTEAFMYRHHPQTKIVGQLVKDGRLGDVTLFRAVFNFAINSRDNVRLFPEMGGGCLWDVGVYPVSLAQYVMGGTPEWVMGDQWLGESGVDEFFSGQMHYSGGRVAQVSSSFRTPLYTMAELIGTNGRLFIPHPFVQMDTLESDLLFYPAGSDEPEKIPVPHKPLYLGEIEDMHAGILDGAPSYLTLAETRDHVRTLLALYESAETGQVVSL